MQVSDLVAQQSQREQELQALSVTSQAAKNLSQSGTIAQQALGDITGG